LTEGEQYIFRKEVPPRVVPPSVCKLREEHLVVLVVVDVVDRHHAERWVSRLLVAIDERARAVGEEDGASGVGAICGITDKVAITISV
jgi:hypothetical protein